MATMPGSEAHPGAEETVGAARSSLDGLRVVDLSSVLAGPYCAQMLGDHGATIVKVESPLGDDTRRWGPPFFPDGSSAYFQAVNRNKQNICIDLKHPDGKELLLRLLEDADVLIENFKPGTMAAWGLDYPDISARFPRLIYARITGYGHDGPLGGLPGYDAVLQAYSGLMSVNGQAGDQPVRIGVPVVDLATGMLALSGILLALHERQRSGRGQLVDCTLLDTAISLLIPHASAWMADGRVPARTGSAHPTIAPYDCFETRTVSIFLSAANDRQFAAMCDVLGLTELPHDPRFRTNSDRLVHRTALRQLLSTPFLEQDGRTLSEALRARGVPATLVNNVAEALSSEQVRVREMVVESGAYKGIGVPVKMTRTPGSVRSTPSGRGADTAGVLASLGLTGAEVAALVREGVVQSTSDEASPPAGASAPLAPPPQGR